jgi:hypothetical protein
MPHIQELMKRSLPKTCQVRRLKESSKFSELVGDCPVIDNFARIPLNHATKLVGRGP